MTKQRQSLADRIAPPRQLASGEWRGVRLRTDLARALALCWAAGEDYDLLFPKPYCPYEIGAVIHDHIVPYLRDTVRRPGGAHGVRDRTVADALDWLAVDHLCTFGKFEDDFTLEQMIDGTLEGEWLQVVGGIGGGKRVRDRWPATMAALVESGFLRITRPSHQAFHVELTDEKIERALATAGERIALTAVDAGRGPGIACDLRDGQLWVSEGDADWAPVPRVTPAQWHIDAPPDESSSRHDGIRGSSRHDGISSGDSSSRHDGILSKQEEVSRLREQDVTDWPSPDGDAGSLDEVAVTAAVIVPPGANGARPDPEPPIPTLPARMVRWLAAEDHAGDLPAAQQHVRREARRLAGASDADLARAYRYAREWRTRRGKQYRGEPAWDQFMQLATAGSLAAQRLQVIAFSLRDGDAGPEPDPAARPRFADPAQEVTRRLHGLHPAWVATRINKTMRAAPEEPWPYVLAALANRAEHEAWLKDRRRAVAASSGGAEPAGK